jgi:hypothetical protein
VDAFQPEPLQDPLPHFVLHEVSVRELLNIEVSVKSKDEGPKPGMDRTAGEGLFKSPGTCPAAVRATSSKTISTLSISLPFATETGMATDIDCSGRS